MTLKPLPKFNTIPLDNIPSASALLYYNGNKMTEWYGNVRYKHPYKPASFHAELYVGDGLSLKVGKFKTISDVTKEFKSTRRIDVIVYSMPEAVRARIRHNALLDATDPKVGVSLPNYGFTDFLRYEPWLQWLPKSKNEICSENVDKMMAKEGVIVAEHGGKIEAAPWMLFEYALAHYDTCAVYTLWEGEDFKKAYPSGQE